jgi:hypothetical protein
MEILIPIFVADFMGKPAWVWLAFVGIVVALLAFDLGVLHKDDREIGVRGPNYSTQPSRILAYCRVPRCRDS